MKSYIGGLDGFTLPVNSGIGQQGKSFVHQPAAVDSFEQMLNEASRGLLVAWQKSGVTHDATKIDERWKSVNLWVFL